MERLFTAPSDIQLRESRAGERRQAAAMDSCSNSSSSSSPKRRMGAYEVLWLHTHVMLCALAIGGIGIDLHVLLRNLIKRHSHPTSSYHHQPPLRGPVPAPARPPLPPPPPPGMLLGAGSFGRVYSGVWRQLAVAVKVVTHAAHETPAMERELQARGGRGGVGGVQALVCVPFLHTRMHVARTHTCVL